MTAMTNLTFDGNLAILELTNGTNAFTHDFVDSLNEALDKVLSNPDADALITHSTGRHFTDGIALTEVFGEGLQSGMSFMEKFCKLQVRWLTFPMPTFAAVNGHAFAGGCIFVMAHDYKVMNADRGWLSLPEAYMPQMFPVILMDIIRCKTPLGNAQRDFITMGKRITGSEAVKLGVIDRTAPMTSLLEETKKYAETSLSFSKYDRSAMRDMKNHLYEKPVMSCKATNSFNFLPPYLLKSQM